MDQEATSQVQVNFSIQIGSGRLDVSAAVPASKVSLVQLVPSIKEMSNNIVGAVEAAVLNEGYRISCTAGCAACCRQLVPLTIFEAEEFGNWIRTLPLEQQAILERRFNESLLRLQAAGMLERLNSAMPRGHDEDFTALSADYFRAGVPCPFLQNEQCSIHPIRPLACREYLVTSPPEFCAAPTRETLRPVPMPVKLSTALASLGEEITQEKRGWMPLVLLFVFLRSGLQLQDAIQGTGPELVQMLLQRIARPAPSSAATG